MFKPSLEKLLAHNIDDFPSFTLSHPLEMNHELWFPLYQAISKQEKYHMILESGRSGRYSIIGVRPTRQLVGKNRELIIHDLTFNGDIHHSHVREGNLLSLMKEYMATKVELQLPELLDINCGLFGYFSYDLVREIECIPEQSQDDLHTPDVNVLEFKQLIVYDHVEQQHWLMLSQGIEESTATSSEKRVREAYRTAQERLIQWNMDLQGTIDRKSVV